MTTAPPTPPQSTAPAQRPGPPGAPGGAPPAPSIDPMRVLKRYKVALIVSVILGGIIGIGVWQVWLRVAPTYTSFAIFEITPQKGEAAEADPQVDLEEMERYMNTQAAVMTGESVLQAVVDRPTIQEDAPTWASQFVESGAFDSRDARRDLQNAVSARPDPNTNLLHLRVSASTSSDAYALVGLVRQEYLNQASQGELARMNKQQDAIRRQIEDQRERISSLQDQREETLRSEGVDSLDGRANEAMQAVEGINEQLNQVRLELESSQEQLDRLETNRDKPNGPIFTDDLRSQVQELPVVAGLKQRVSEAETELRALEAAGTGRRAVPYRQMKSRVESLKVELEDQKRRELERMFFGRIESLKSYISSLQAQEADLMSRKDELKEQLNRLAIVQAEIQDIEREIENTRATIAELERNLDNLEALEAQATEESGGRDAFGRDQILPRIELVQSEEVPDKVSWPDPIVVVPATALLVVGLTGGLIVLRELLDQRVKGPADVSLIPRTRVLGMIPLSTEDPARLKSVETAFRDHPQGALAEQFRSVRTLLTKHMHQSGQRSLVVTAGFPDSGTTTVALNLAFACAASEQRVLLIDANLRRSSIHSMLGLAPQPGLVDVVGGKATLGEAIQPSGTPRLDVLAAGSPDDRVFERLACPAMDQLLAEAKREYDVVLVDSAPMVVAGDALALANKCDASVLIVKALSEKRGLVARLRNELSDARGELLGVLVNGVRASAGGYLRRNMRATHEYQKDQRSPRA